MATSDAIRTIRHPLISHALDELLVDCKQDFRMRLWDGTTWESSDDPKFTLTVNNPDALRTLFVSPTELSLGEEYIGGNFDIEGDMEAACEFGEYLLSQPQSSSLVRSLMGMLDRSSWSEKSISPDRGLRLCGPVHSRQRDSQVVRYHYDVPPDFFGLWLDRHMMYSCAYFADGNITDLDAAQECKLEYICKKLRLRPGHHLLDIGCGWGGFIAYAAQRGVYAHGITLSLRQAEIARRRIHEAALDSRCRVEVCDYRDVESGHQFDRIASIGMFEHVGETRLPEYFERVWKLLRPGGIFLNSGIACSPSYSQRIGPSFVDRYVFPDGELVPLNKSLAAAEEAGFEVRDVESLREHYAMTLHQWLRRLEACAVEARSITNETSYRIWRLYMAGSERLFRSGALNLYHMLLTKPVRGDSGMPLTRSDWYG
jgi:cyclopropane-fatty-acyl-phospholipid synthase